MSKLEEDLERIKMLLLLERLLRLRDGIGSFLSVDKNDQKEIALRLKKMKEYYERSFLD